MEDKEMEKQELVELRNKFSDYRLSGIIKAVYDESNERDDYVSCSEVYKRIKNGGYLPDDFEFEMKELCGILRDCANNAYLLLVPREIEDKGKLTWVSFL